MNTKFDGIISNEREICANPIFSSFITSNWNRWRRDFEYTGVIAVDQERPIVWGWGKSVGRACTDASEKIEKTPNMTKPVKILLLNLDESNPSLEMPEILMKDILQDVFKE